MCFTEIAKSYPFLLPPPIPYLIPDLILSMNQTQQGSSKVGCEDTFNKLFSNFKILQNDDLVLG